MNEILIHVGYPRTASTFLQEYVFVKNNDINYLGRIGKIKNENWQPYHDIEYLISTCNENEYDKIKASTLIPLLDKINFSNEKINVISHEGFTRSTRFNLFDGKNNLRTVERLVDLFSLFGNVRIMLCIRKQESIIASHMTSFYQFFKPYNFGLLNLILVLYNLSIKNKFILDNFKYSDIVNYLTTNEHNRSLILFYEELKFDKKKFLVKISKFLKIKNTFLKENRIINSSNKKNQKINISIFNKFTKNITNKITNFTKYKSYLSSISDFIFIKISYFFPYKTLRSKIYDYYIDDNLKINKKYRKLLIKYGYI